MSKQIYPEELAALVTRLLTDPNTISDHLDSPERFGAFMTAVTTAVCDACGGEVRFPASFFDDQWAIGVHGNDSLPEDGGIWKDLDKDGSLCASDSETLTEQIREEFVLSSESPS